MGVWGGIIMGFFGAIFAALTMDWQWHVTGPLLMAPLLGSGVIALVAIHVIRLPGQGVIASERVGRVIVWSSVAEGIGVFLAANIVVNLNRPEWLLPAIALIVGLHFLPIAIAATFRPFYILGTTLIGSAIIGVVAPAPAGGEIAGFSAAAGLYVAAILAVRRDRDAKRGRAAFF